MRNLTRRAALLGVGAALGVAGTRYMSGAVPDMTGAGPAPALSAPDVMNDASGLSATPVHRHVVTDNTADALVARLRAELRDAQAGNRPLNIGAARHSMGAQAIPRDGTAITFGNTALDANGLSLSYFPATATYRVHGGARWSQVIAALDAQRLSPKVMQSNNDFSLAATFSVNAHGWPVPFGPMGSTVRSITMMLADGTVLTASRTENADLFAHAMGGYGLIGLILEMEIEAVPNLLLDPSFDELPARDFAPAFMAAVSDPGVNMAYGRLNVDRARFFEDAFLITFRPAADQTDIPPAEGSGFVSKAAARMYRAQLANERWKRIRWGMETGLGPMVTGQASRNSLMNEPVVTLDDRNPLRTDILHEYFVSPDRFGDFLNVCRDVIPSSYQEMLNVTLRYVAADPVSVLAHSPVERIAAVMSFSQEMTTRAEADMTRMTRDLIDGITGIGGTYYLPYRPHATVEQFARAYPKAAAFAARKREIDPKLTLRGGLWDNYLGKL